MAKNKENNSQSSRSTRFIGRSADGNGAQNLEATEEWAQEIADDAGLLLDSLPSVSLPRERRVFVNRNLRMDTLQSVGFDMDYTLAVYHHMRLESLAYRLTTEGLVRDKGYPNEVLDLVYQPNAVVRGLVIDRQLGNIFKMDRHYHVSRVQHGRYVLSKEERVNLYRKQKVPIRSKRFVWLDTLFAIPEAALYVDLVDLFDKRARDYGERVDYASIYDDVRETIDLVHKDGSLKTLVKQDLPYYIRREVDIAPTLHRLRSSGKRLFLLTNSDWDYTNAVMSFLLDGILPEYSSWRSYFDIVIVGANKPAFFEEKLPFAEVDPATGHLGSPGIIPQRGGIYAGGNLWDLEEGTGWAGDRVLYVGDHIYGDMLRTKRSAMWRTAMIVQEVEEEVAYFDENKTLISLLRRLDEMRLRIDDEISFKKAVVSYWDRCLAIQGVEKVAVGAGCPNTTSLVQTQRNQQEARRELDKMRTTFTKVLRAIRRIQDDLHEGLNPSWGMVFKEGQSNSRFAEQVEVYACLYTGRVSNLLAYSPMRYFRSRSSPMPHEIEDLCDF